MAVNTPKQYRPSLDIWNRDPRLIFLLVNTIVAGVSAFGLKLDGDQVGVIMATTNVLLALIYNSEMVMPVSVANAQITQALNTPAPNQTETKIEVTKVEENTK